MNDTIAFPIWSDLNRWIHSGQQPHGYEFAAHISRCFAGIKDLPPEISTYDWKRSFDIPQVIYYDERVTVEVVESLHQYLRTQCCDIENIVLLTSHCVGLREWWTKRCELYQERSFRVVEWLFVRTHAWRYHFQDLAMIPKNQVLENKRNLAYLFNFYGGTNPRLDRLYLTLKMRDLDPVGLTDLLCDFSVSHQQILGHAMYLGYFKDSQEEHKMSDLYERYVQDQKLQINPVVHQMRQQAHTVDPRGIKAADPRFGSDSYQFWFDSHFLCTVTNETDNTQPWAMVSEKTLRPFWHHNIVIPNAYQSVQLLESKGFWFPHDIIDYSYQEERDWLSRINRMSLSLQKTHDRLQGRYTEYFQDNFDRFQHNARLLQQYHQEDLD